MQSQMQRQCESELCEGILGRKSSRRGIGKFRAKLFFFSSFPIQICKLPCYQNAKEYFFLFLFLYKKKKSSVLHCLSFQSKPLGQCYREAVEVLQLEKRKEKLSYLQSKHLVLTSAWRSALAEWKPGQIHSALLSPTVVSSPTYMFVFSQAGHTHFSYDWHQNEHLQLLLKLQNKPA